MATPEHQLLSTLTMLVAVCETTTLDLDQHEPSAEPRPELEELRRQVERTRDVALRLLRPGPVDRASPA